MTMAAQVLPAQASVGPLIRRLRRAILERYGETGLQAELLPIEALLMRLLDQLEPAEPGQLCGIAAIDKVTFSKAMRKLQAAGQVDCVEQPEDRRKRWYRLTAIGRARLSVIDEATRAAETAFLAPLGPRDRKLFRRLLTRLVLSHSMHGNVRQDGRAAAVLDRGLDLGLLLRRARQISVALFDKECGRFGLTPLEHGALCVVGAMGPLRRGDLQALLAIDRGSTATSVAGLVEAGAIQADATWLTVTESGKSLIAAMAAPVQAVETRILASLTQRERPQLLRLMRRLDKAWSAG